MGDGLNQCPAASACALVVQIKRDGIGLHSVLRINGQIAGDVVKRLIPTGEHPAGAGRNGRRGGCCAMGDGLNQCPAASACTLVVQIKRDGIALRSVLRINGQIAGDVAKRLIPTGEHPAGTGRDRRRGGCCAMGDGLNQCPAAGACALTIQIKGDGIGWRRILRKISRDGFVGVHCNRYAAVGAGCIARPVGKSIVSGGCCRQGNKIALRIGGQIGRFGDCAIGGKDIEGIEYFRFRLNRIFANRVHIVADTKRQCLGCRIALVRPHCQRQRNIVIAVLHIARP